MPKATIDNRYIRVQGLGGKGVKYPLRKQPAAAFFVEVDLSDWLAAGPSPNVAALTVSGGGTVGVWTDPGANAPVATAGTHTATSVFFALTGGSLTLWNAGAGGGYRIGEGALKFTVTAPTTGETKEIVIVVTLEEP